MKPQESKEHFLNFFNQKEFFLGSFQSKECVPFRPRLFDPIINAWKELDDLEKKLIKEQGNSINENNNNSDFFKNTPNVSNNNNNAKAPSFSK